MIALFAAASIFIGAGSYAVIGSSAKIEPAVDILAKAPVAFGDVKYVDFRTEVNLTGLEKLDNLSTIKSLEFSAAFDREVGKISGTATSFGFEGGFTTTRADYYPRWVAARLLLSSTQNYISLGFGPDERVDDWALSVTGRIKLQELSGKLSLYLHGSAILGVYGRSITRVGLILGR